MIDALQFECGTGELQKASWKRWHLFCVLKDLNLVVVKRHFKEREEHETGMLRHEQPWLGLIPRESNRSRHLRYRWEWQKGGYWILLSWITMLGSNVHITLGVMGRRSWRRWTLQSASWDRTMIGCSGPEEGGREEQALEELTKKNHRALSISWI